MANSNDINVFSGCQNQKTRFVLINRVITPSPGVESNHSNVIRFDPNKSQQTRLLLRGDIYDNV